MKRERAFRRFLRGAILAVVPGTAWMGAYGCVLGLDPTLVERHGHGSDASTDAAIDSPFATDASVLTDARRSDGIVCEDDADCVVSEGCLRGRCDRARSRCVYMGCERTQCQAATCDTERSVCGPLQSHGFHAASWTIAKGPIACGGRAAACIAAIEPFVFVGTRNGVEVLSALEPTNPAPRRFAVGGVPFVPEQLIASGTRLYILGPRTGSGADARVSLAWLEVPPFPSAAAWMASSTLVAFPQGPPLAFAAPAGELLLVGQDRDLVFPSGTVRPPMADFSLVTSHASTGFPDGATPAVGSGGRLVTARWVEDQRIAAFSLQERVGTPTSQNAGERVFADPSAVGRYFGFGGGAAGSVLWTSLATAVDPDGGGPSVGSARLVWLLDDENDDTLSTTAGVRLESYPQVPESATLLGPVAAVDGNTAMALVAHGSDRDATLVRVAVRAGATVTVDENRRYVVPARPDRTGLATSQDGAFVLATNPEGAAVVHLFAPGCDTAP